MIYGKVGEGLEEGEYQFILDVNDNFFHSIIINFTVSNNGEVSYEVSKLYL